MPDMSSTSRLVLVVIGIIVLCAGIYMVVARKPAPSDESGTPDSAMDEETTGAPMGKVGASTESDGVYFVQIQSVNANPEDTTLTLSHVTYFEGEEATLSAKAEVECPSGIIEDCVPTLKDGFYVRPSGAPQWTAPVSKEVAITLKDGVTATMDDIAALVNTNHEAIMVVTVEGGMITTIEERGN